MGFLSIWTVLSNPFLSLLSLSRANIVFASRQPEKQKRGGKGIRRRRNRGWGRGLKRKSVRWSMQSDEISSCLNIQVLRLCWLKHNLIFQPFLISTQLQIFWSTSFPLFSSSLKAFLYFTIFLFFFNWNYKHCYLINVSSWKRWRLEGAAFKQARVWK